LITLALAAITLLLVLKVNVAIKASPATNIAGVWRSFHTALKRLLISDVIIRMCEGMTGVLTIL
jgi:isocitrate dehydrogenase